jgi:macrolide transport system ATP-binding/permease protein
MWQRWRRRLRYWLHREERARLLREEMELHLELKTQELMEDGLPEPEARSAARRQFGNPASKQEEARDTWIARWATDLVRDTTFAARTVRKQPGFALLAALSAALGIGACSLVFSIANFALFHLLPIHDPSRLMTISGQDLRGGRAGRSMTYPDIADLRQAASFSAITAYFAFMPAGISGGGDPQRCWGTIATADYFEVVRPSFALGHGFDPARGDRKGEAPVVVLSYSLWRSRFGGDGRIVGRTVELNGLKTTVVGVTGPDFRGVESMVLSDFWVPFSMLNSLADVGMRGERLTDRGSQWLSAVGRLRDGASERTAASELDVIGKRLRTAYPATNQDRGFHVERAGQLNPGIRRTIMVFFALLLVVSVLVLCTACANVANLLLARASARQKEIATRLAIGAGRGRLVRQLLTESLMLALIGGIAGYAIARAGAAAIGRVRAPLSLPIDFSISLDYRVMLFSAGLAALTGVIFGLAPALRATRPNLTTGLKGERFGLRNVLIVAQVAICMVLLVCSGLFLRSLQSAGGIDTGMAHRNVLMAAFDPSLNRYSASQTKRVVDAILADTAALSGVESASLSTSAPLNLEGTQNGFTAGDQSTPIIADIYSVSPRFFDTFGIRMLAGEDFRPGVPADDIAIVNQALADKAFPKQYPVGRTISYFGRTVRIVALVATAKSRTIGEEPHPCLYFPISRELRGNDSLSGMTLAIRTLGNPAAYVATVRQTIGKIDPALAVFDVRTMDAQIWKAMFLPRVSATLFGLAGLMGLLISTVGIYGVISFSVARQTKDIGIRVALGAQRWQVLAMVLEQGFVLTLIGTAIGMGAALVLSRITASLLYGISPTDTLTFTVVPAALFTIAAVACLVPARRAARLDPILALRCE